MTRIPQRLTKTPTIRCFLAVCSLASVLCLGAVPRTAQAAKDAALVESFPSVTQWHDLDCEYAAAAAVTLYWGNLVSQRDFIREVPTSPNPHRGFRGDIEGEFGGIDNYGVYAEA